MHCCKKWQASEAATFPICYFCDTVVGYGIDLFSVLPLSIQHGFSEQCVIFYEYLVDEVKNLHSKERKDPVPSIIPQTYIISLLFRLLKYFEELISYLKLNNSMNIAF